MSKAHPFHLTKEDIRFICNSCDLNEKCGFYKNKSYRFTYGPFVSSHVPAKEESYEDRALLCYHRNKIFEREGIGVLGV